MSFGKVDAQTDRLFRTATISFLPPKRHSIPGFCIYMSRNHGHRVERCAYGDRKSGFQVRNRLSPDE